METLFEIPDQPLTALQSARLMFDAAKAAYDELPAGEGVGSQQMYDYFRAQSYLISCEADELRRLNQSPGPSIEASHQ